MAQYMVEAIDAPLSGRPVWIRIDHMNYVDRGNGYEIAATSGDVPVLTRLKQAVKARTVCTETARGSVHGVAAIQYRFEDRVAAGAVHQWLLCVGTVSGLPLVNEIENAGAGGFVWVYGEQVTGQRQSVPVWGRRQALWQGTRSTVRTQRATSAS